MASRSKLPKTPAQSNSLLSFFSKTPTTSSKPASTSPANTKQNGSSGASKQQAMPLQLSDDEMTSNDNKENAVSDATKLNSFAATSPMVVKKEPVAAAAAVNGDNDDDDEDEAPLKRRPASTKRAAAVKRKQVADSESEYSDAAAESSESDDDEASAASSSSPSASSSASASPIKPQPKAKRAKVSSKPAATKATGKAAAKSTPKSKKAASMFGNGDKVSSKDDNEDMVLASNDEVIDQSDDVTGQNGDGHQQTFRAQLEFLRPENRQDADRRRPSHPHYNPRTLHIPEAALNAMTPGERQYWQFKRQNMDMLMLFKMGKFYEIFDEDADIAVREIGLGYMGKQSRPHAGFPEQAYGKYSALLAQRGINFVRVEQTETPAMLKERNARTAGKNDKTVARKIVSITTRGTQMDPELLTSNAKYIVAFTERLLPDMADDASSDALTEYGIVFADCGTAQFTIGQLRADKQRSELKTLLAQLNPVEILYCPQTLQPASLDIIKHESAAQRTMLSTTSHSAPGDAWDLDITLSTLKSNSYFTINETSEQDNVSNDAEFTGWPQPLVEVLKGETGNDGMLAMSAFGLMLSYFTRLKCDKLLSLRNFRLLDMTQIQQRRAVTGNGDEDEPPSAYLHLDAQTLSNLEIVTNERGGQEGTLLRHLDKCTTAFGRRLLREWLLVPLADIRHINRRLDAVSELMRASELMNTLRQSLRTIPDLDRLLQRIHHHSQIEMTEAIMYENVGKKKIKDLVDCLRGLEAGQTMVHQHCAAGFQSALLQSLKASFPDMRELIQFFTEAFDSKEALLTGSIIPRTGVNAAYDKALADIEQCHSKLKAHLKEIKQHNGLSQAKYVDKIKERFQIELPGRPNVPEDFELVSQTQSVIRYYTPTIKKTLKKLELAEDQRDATLSRASQEMFAQFTSHYSTWKRAVQVIGTLDVLISLALTSSHQNEAQSCRPVFLETADINDKPVLELRQAVHPVLCGSDRVVHDLRGHSRPFIPNDALLGTAENPATVMLLSGPNMGGKSTLMRQVALCVIMAQIGCYVPADVCKLTVTDRIFTRIGASDRLMRGESTFQVELTETSRLVRHATRQSLVILDELGRGTSTFDGTAIADAVLTYLATKIQCRALFSTHYHMLISKHVEDRDIIAQYTMAYEADPDSEDLVFTYRLIAGSTTQSHAFNVARMTDLPTKVIDRASHEANRMLARITQAYQYARERIASNGNKAVEQLAAVGSDLAPALTVAHPSSALPRRLLHAFQAAKHRNDAVEMETLKQQLADIKRKYLVEHVKDVKQV